MKRWLFQIALLVVCNPAAQARADAALPQPKPVWHTDYEQAKAIALREGKPLFVVFR
jgi:hypothetical protein